MNATELYNNFTLMVKELPADEVEKYAEEVLVELEKIAGKGISTKESRKAYWKNVLGTVGGTVGGAVVGGVATLPIGGIGAGLGAAGGLAIARVAQVKNSEKQLGREMKSSEANRTLVRNILPPVALTGNPGAIMRKQETKRLMEKGLKKEDINAAMKEKRLDYKESKKKKLEKTARKATDEEKALFTPANLRSLHLRKYESAVEREKDKAAWKQRDKSLELTRKETRKFDNLVMKTEYRNKPLGKKILGFNGGAVGAIKVLNKGKESVEENPELNNKNIVPEIKAYFAKKAAQSPTYDVNSGPYNAPLDHKGQKEDKPIGKKLLIGAGMGSAAAVTSTALASALKKKSLPAAAVAGIAGATTGAMYAGMRAGANKADKKKDSQEILLDKVAGLKEWLGKVFNKKKNKTPDADHLLDVAIATGMEIEHIPGNTVNEDIIAAFEGKKIMVDSKTGQYEVFDKETIERETIIPETIERETIIPETIEYETVRREIIIPERIRSSKTVANELKSKEQILKEASEKKPPGGVLGALGGGFLGAKTYNALRDSRAVHDATNKASKKMFELKLSRIDKTPNPLRRVAKKGKAYAGRGAGKAVKFTTGPLKKGVAIVGGAIAGAAGVKAITGKIQEKKRKEEIEAMLQSVAGECIVMMEKTALKVGNVPKVKIKAPKTVGPKKLKVPKSTVTKRDPLPDVLNNIDLIKNASELSTAGKAYNKVKIKAPTLKKQPIKMVGKLKEKKIDAIAKAASDIKEQMFKEASVVEETVNDPEKRRAIAGGAVGGVGGIIGLKKVYKAKRVNATKKMATKLKKNPGLLNFFKRQRIKMRHAKTYAKVGKKLKSPGAKLIAAGVGATVGVMGAKALGNIKDQNKQADIRKYSGGA